jgi:hypothetical protein
LSSVVAPEQSASTKMTDKKKESLVVHLMTRMPVHILSLHHPYFIL